MYAFTNGENIFSSRLAATEIFEMNVLALFFWLFVGCSGVVYPTNRIEGKFEYHTTLILK